LPRTLPPVLCAKSAHALIKQHSRIEPPPNQRFVEECISASTQPGEFEFESESLRPDKPCYNPARLWAASRYCQEKNSFTFDKEI
jgi:hypothetical protein